LALFLAGCASPRRPGCNVQSDCGGGTYCADPDPSGNRFCNFDCKVPSDCVGMVGAICSDNGRCLAGQVGDDAGVGDDAELPVEDAATPDAAQPDARVVDAAVADARLVDAAMADARLIDAATADAALDAAVACTLVAPQSGCTGQACDLIGDRNACRPNGTQQHGQPCGVGMDCVAGATCLSDDKCHQFCVSGGAACPASGTCTINVIGSANQTLATACADPRPTCNVLTQDCVGATTSCYVAAGPAFQCFSPTGVKAENAVCDAVNDCAKPLSCLDIGSTGTFRCHHPCDRMAAVGAQGCRAGQTCSNVGLGAFVGMCTPAMP
jgi:hypothetical protein